MFTIPFAVVNEDPQSSPRSIHRSTEIYSSNTPLKSSDLNASHSTFISNFQLSSEQFKNVEVRVGDTAVTDSATYAFATSSNKRCAVLKKAQPALTYYTFVCNNLKGQYITLSSSQHIGAYEVEVFGKE